LLVKNSKSQSQAKAKFYTTEEKERWRFTEEREGLMWFCRNKTITFIRP
jgi:hypothetical protein